MPRLEGKRAVIIGAAAGIGAATARAMGAEGARVVVADVALEAAEAVATDITAAGGDAVARWVDVQSEEAIRDLVEGVVELYGGLDVIHNNAAALSEVEDRMNPVLDIDTDVWDRVMGINLRGMWLGCRYAVPHLRAAGGGSIINTSSVASLLVQPGSGASSIAKGALNTLTRTVAAHYGHDRIRCNAILPGIIDTGRMSEEFGSTLLRHNIIPRVGAPEDIAHLAVYLAADESSYVTGQLITVDGGFSIHTPTWADLTAAPEVTAGQWTGGTATETTGVS